MLTIPATAYFQSKAFQRHLYLLYLGLAVVASSLAFALDAVWLLAIPAVLATAVLLLIDLRTAFFLLLSMIPLSTEIEINNKLGTDLPTEPMIILLMLGYGLILIRKMDKRFLTHPVSLLLGLHLSWILITTLTSGTLLVSFKFLLAKIWYIVVFYYLTGAILREPKDLVSALRWIFPTLAITILYTLFRHGMEGFTFKAANEIVRPFYRNHVNYAAILAVLFPFALLLRLQFKPYTGSRYWTNFLILLILAGIFFSYTRAAYLCILGLPIIHLVLRWKLIRPFLGLSIFVVAGLVVYLNHRNQYLQLAPKYERAISHDEFGNLLTATYKGEDISTMERLYRWVAGARMISDKPVTGFGPGNFYNYYKTYTLRRFRTYVSQNPERSGVHCYFLMTAVEQGIPGLLIFLALLFFALVRGEYLFGKLAGRPERNYLEAAYLSLVTIIGLLLINDLIETDKVGSFFFISLAILVNAESWITPTTTAPEPPDALLENR